MPAPVSDTSTTSVPVWYLGPSSTMSSGLTRRPPIMFCSDPASFLRFGGILTDERGESTEPWRLTATLCPPPPPPLCGERGDNNPCDVSVCECDCEYGCGGDKEEEVQGRLWVIF